ncbi:MAG: O-antigen ligase family protein [Myxococcota bacterium]
MERPPFLAIAAIALAVAMTLGEGVGLGALGLLAAAMWRRRNEDTHWDSVALYPALGIGIWLGAGVLAWVLGGYGVMDIGEIGRWMSFSALVVVPLSVQRLPPRWLDRIGQAYFATLLLAVVFALGTVALNARPGEWLVRGASNGIHQGRRPFDSSRTVAGGFYFHRLKFAHVACLGAIAMVARQLALPLKPGRRALEGAALVATLVALLLTYVRADVLGLATGMFVMGLFAGRRSQFALVALALLSVIGIAAVPSVSERVASIFAAQASSERALIWSQAVRIIADHPMGVGLGNYSSVVSAYYDTVDPAFPTRTYGHNLWLTQWAETGPLGVMGFLGGFIAVAYRARFRLPDPHALCLIGGTACFLTIGLTHDVFYDPPVALSYTTVLAFCAARLFDLAPAASRESEPYAKERS